MDKCMYNILECSTNIYVTNGSFNSLVRLPLKCKYLTVPWTDGQMPDKVITLSHSAQ